MKVLVIGSGGREHALAWKLASSPRVSEVFCAPGNAGTAAFAKNVPISAGDITALVDFASKEGIGLTVVGPDDTLAAGVSDAFLSKGLRIFGPKAEAAQLEASKAFAKDFMRRHGIPTAAYEEFTDAQAAYDYCKAAKYPLVVKADGLALGKGVVIAETVEDATTAIHRAMELKVFGEAGARVVIEEFLTGVECSIHAIVDASGYCFFPDCKDHKRAFDGDQGPNTGGMGTISPSGVLTPELEKQVHEDVLGRFVAGLRKDGLEFHGMLFPGLMVTADGPKVLEFNCRFGDPETQVLMRRLKSDLLDLIEACVDDRIASAKAEWDTQAAACIILASGGYPEAYEKGKPITGLEEANSQADVVVFHAGTALCGEDIVTNGGRVLGVTALGQDLPEARRKAYAAADIIHFDQMQRRNDIGGA
jgi:phosphoribosylamine--glycine ligase